MGAPYFSIVIPTYNRAEQLMLTVKSVLQQSFESFEIVIVDDGSTDHTSQVIAPLISNKVSYFKTQNLERSHARNLGAKMAKGSYLNFFDSDDIMYPDRLQKVYDFIDRSNEPDVLFTYYDLIDGSGKKIGSTERYYSSFTKDLLFNNFLATGSVFLKRRLALANPFVEDRRLITAEDWECWLRIHAMVDFTEFPEKTFAIVQHGQRSLDTITTERIEERDLFFISLIKGQKNLTKRYGRELYLFVADRYTFIALVFAIVGRWTSAAHYLVLSIRSSFYVVTRRRFWGVLKNIIF
jgi:glycosyltransferase involved in cell wall biosynthesis